MSKTAGTYPEKIPMQSSGVRILLKAAAVVIVGTVVLLAFFIGATSDNAVEVGTLAAGITTAVSTILSVFLLVVVTNIVLIVFRWWVGNQGWDRLAVMYWWAWTCVISGFWVFLLAPAVTQEIAGLLFFLIAAVLFCGVTVVEEIRKNQAGRISTNEP